jgi:hypothetical protein
MPSCDTEDERSKVDAMQEENHSPEFGDLSNKIKDDASTDNVSEITNEGVRTKELAGSKRSIPIHPPGTFKAISLQRKVRAVCNTPSSSDSILLAARTETDVAHSLHKISLKENTNEPSSRPSKISMIEARKATVGEVEKWQMQLEESLSRGETLWTAPLLEQWQAKALDVARRRRQTFNGISAHQ